MTPTSPPISKFGQLPTMASRARGTILPLVLPLTLPLGAALLLVSLAATGCGRFGPPARKMVAVSGMISFDGKPLPEGFVSFVSPSEGRFETFPIKDGRFAGKSGLGQRTVEVIAIRDAQPAAAGGGDKGAPRAVRENYLPAKYSTASTLTAEVTESGANVFDFDLRSKP
jgi:hypothetical protein